MPQYQSYLLRLWPTKTAGSTVWHASLENAKSGERTNFASLEDMFFFIRGRTCGEVNISPDEER